MSSLYRRYLLPALFRVPAERVHHLALTALTAPGAAEGWRRVVGDTGFPGLGRELWGLRFRNPVGLAAGFDKNAIALPAWDALGFGFTEIGTVTPMAQEGNPKPRLFRVPDVQGVINRLGFPNEGMEVIAARLAALRRSGKWPSIPVGINIGKNKTTPLKEAPEDYVKCFRTLRPHGDYFVINVSSPNTPGLRELQQKKALGEILAPVQAENNAKGTTRRPILLKIAPDLTEAELEEILETALAHKLDGIIATNTTLDRTGVGIDEAGGLSGAPLRARSTGIIGRIAELTHGKLPIIGVGGIFSAADAREKLDAGASLVQTYTGFIYEGPLTAKRICEGLAGRR